MTIPRLMELGFNIIALLLATGIILVIILIVAGLAMLCGASFKLYLARGAWFLLLPWVAWLYGSFIERNCFRVKRVTIQSEKLPAAFDGYRIVQISDVHLSSFDGRERALQRAVNKINALQPDLIAVTGDLVSMGHWELDGKQEILSGLKANDGVYSIMGNHDYSEYHRWKSQQDRNEALEQLQRREREMGWNLLLNQNKTIARGTDSISIIGVENISAGRHSFRTYGNLPQAMQNANGAYKVLLSHDPSHWRAEVLEKSDIDLMLAGHTHSMQVSLLGWSPSSLIYDEYRGLYTENNQHLYVNVGLGETAFMARIGVMPEITLIELKCK